jgi:hypothetical protein
MQPAPPCLKCKRQYHVGRDGFCLTCLYAKKPQRKYRNVPTTVDEIEFASAAEASRYAELKLLLRAGKIQYLQLQPVFELQPSMKGQTAINYVGDFAYQEMPEGNWIVEDVKGVETAVFKLKRKMMAYVLPTYELRVIAV